MILKIKLNANFVEFGMLRKTNVKASAFSSVFCFWFVVGFFFSVCGQFHPNVEIALLEGSTGHRINHASWAPNSLNE